MRATRLSLHLKDSLPFCFWQSVSPVHTISALCSLLPFQHRGTPHALHSHRLSPAPGGPCSSAPVYAVLAMLLSHVCGCAHIYAQNRKLPQPRTAEDRETSRKKKKWQLTEGETDVWQGGEEIVGNHQSQGTGYFLKRWGIVSSYSARHHANYFRDFYL